MGLERREGYWLWIDGPVAPGAAATTFGSVILMHAGHVGNEKLLRHELEHVAQYRQYGVMGFFRHYLPGYWRGRRRRLPHWAAYRRIPFEIEAEWRARRSFVDPGGDIPPVRP